MGNEEDPTYQSLFSIHTTTVRVRIKVVRFKLLLHEAKCFGILSLCFQSQILYIYILWIYSHVIKLKEHELQIWIAPLLSVLQGKMKKMFWNSVKCRESLIESISHSTQGYISFQDTLVMSYEIDHHPHECVRSCELGS